MTMLDSGTKGNHVPVKCIQMKSKNIFWFHGKLQNFIGCSLCIANFLIEWWQLAIQRERPKLFASFLRRNQDIFNSFFLKHVWNKLICHPKWPIYLIFLIVTLAKILGRSFCIAKVIIGHEYLATEKERLLKCPFYK